MLAVLIMAVAMVSVFLAIRKREGCLYRNGKWKLGTYILFVCGTIVTIVMTCLMYNIMASNFNKINESVCGVDNYSAQLLLGAPAGSSGSWAGLDPL